MVAYSFRTQITACLRLLAQVEHRLGGAAGGIGDVELAGLEKLLGLLDGLEIYIVSFKGLLDVRLLGGGDVFERVSRGRAVGGLGTLGWSACRLSERV